MALIDRKRNEQRRLKKELQPVDPLKEVLDILINYSNNIYSDRRK